ncbi:MAG: LysR family transcriptional regulator, partial [Cyanobacteria bacterium J06626_26]
MNISQLNVLVTIGECGSFSDAALKLDMSQSAVSRAIASLENELAVALLVRGRLGAKLTPIGERVVKHANQILDLRESIEYEVNLEKSLYKCSQILHVCRNPSIARICIRYVQVFAIEVSPFANGYIRAYDACWQGFLHTSISCTGHSQGRKDIFLKNFCLNFPCSSFC